MLSSLFSFADGSVLWSLMNQASLPVKVILAILLFFSIVSWSVIFERFFYFKKAFAQAKSFEKEFVEATNYDVLAQLVKVQPHHPMRQLFLVGLKEWKIGMACRQRYPSFSLRSVRDRIWLALDLALDKESFAFKRSLSILATVSASAPFIGLLGTVWGIMDAFLGLSTATVVTLAVVAPGIAEALFATAFGLFTAIPCLIAYNYFSAKSDDFFEKCEYFSKEFDSLIANQIDDILMKESMKDSSLELSLVKNNETEKTEISPLQGEEKSLSSAESSPEVSVSEGSVTTQVRFNEELRTRVLKEFAKKKEQAEAAQRAEEVRGDVIKATEGAEKAYNTAPSQSKIGSL